MTPPSDSGQPILHINPYGDPGWSAAAACKQGFANQPRPILKSISFLETLNIYFEIQTTSC